MAGHNDRYCYNRPNVADSRPPPWELNTFRDAVGVALEFSGYYSAATLAFLVADDGGRVDRFFVADYADQSIMLGLNWAVGAATEPEQRHCPPNQRRRTLLITIDGERPQLLAGEDIGLFHWAVRALSTAGAPLDDWIYTDGELVRSASFASNPRAAWPSDPPHHRLIDQTMMACEPQWTNQMEGNE